jgi:transcriptional regulator with XRE-family HTH domain
MRASTSEMLQSILDTGMSRERLAEALGVTPEDVDRLIQGESPSNDVAITISEDGLELDVTKRAGLTCIMDDIQQSSEVSTDLLELRAWLAGHLERMATILGVRR